VLFRVVKAIESIDSPTVAAAFLRSSNPQLDDEAPLVVLATQPVDEAEQAVLAAAWLPRRVSRLLPVPLPGSGTVRVHPAPEALPQLRHECPGAQ
jgi:hypothetical protein